MEIVVDIPENVLREAARRGIPVDALIQERLSGAPDFASRRGYRSFGSGKLTASAAAEDIRRLRVGQTLGGDLTVRQLIEEGRRS